MSRFARALPTLITAALALALTGCAGGSPEPTRVPLTRTATQPPVITRIVTPPPTPTITPVPTQASDLLEALGSWTLRITLDVTGSEFVDQQSYFGAADFDVDERGTISGSGYFTATLSGGRCDAQVLDGDPLNFRVEGAIVPVGDRANADLRLIPENRLQREPYRVVCPEAPETARERDTPYLWPLLADLDLLALPLTLEIGHRVTVEADLSATTTGYDGQLVGEIQVNRG